MLKRIITGAAVASIGLMAVAGCAASEPTTGYQSDGSYRVTDYWSHVDMCVEMHADQTERNTCVNDAWQVWYGDKN